MPPVFEPFHFTSSDDLSLYGRRYGWANADKTAVLCLPGLTRSSEDFDVLAQYLASEAGGSRRVITMDYRGRGNSQWDKSASNYTILTEADDVVAGLTALGIDHVHLIGTSRGGLIAMVLAAMRPGILKSVIFNDIGPELNGPGLVRIKQRMEKAGKPKTLEAAAQQLELGFRSQFPNLTSGDWLEQARQIYTDRKGKLITRYDPKLVEGLRAINLDVRLADMWPQFRGLRNIPNLLLHGELSDLITTPIIDRMRKENPALGVVTVPNEGHAPLLKDAPTLKAVAAFLAKA